MFIHIEENGRNEELFLEKLCLILLGIIIYNEVVVERLKRNVFVCLKNIEEKGKDICRKLLFFVIINNDRLRQIVKEISKFF